MLGQWNYSPLRTKVDCTFLSRLVPGLGLGKGEWQGETAIILRNIFHLAQSDRSKETAAILV